MTRSARASALIAAIVMSGTSVANAASIPPRQASPATPQKLIVGTPGQILTYNLADNEFKLTSNYTEVGFAPSWMQPRGGGGDNGGGRSLLYTVNENGIDTRVFCFDNELVSAQGPLGEFNGSLGVVTLGFNSDQTRLLGGSYTNGTVDVWNSEDTNGGTLSLIKTLNLTGQLGPEQTSHRAHEVVLDPTGQFFAVVDLGGDQVGLVDARGGRYEFVADNYVATGVGSGPRHGKFLTVGATGQAGSYVQQQATHFVVVTELSNEVILYSLEYTAEGIRFTQVQRQTTFPEGTEQPIETPDGGAAAGEVIVLGNRDVYVSNRRTGLPAGDNIVFFQIEQGQLVFKQVVNSGGGTFPRSFGFNADGSVMLVANQNGETSLAAFTRCTETGVLGEEPFATLKNDSVVLPYFASQDRVGPSFVLAL